MSEVLVPEVSQGLAENVAEGQVQGDAAEGENEVQVVEEIQKDEENVDEVNLNEEENEVDVDVGEEEEEEELEEEEPLEDLRDKLIETRRSEIDDLRDKLAQRQMDELKSMTYVVENEATASHDHPPVGDGADQGGLENEAEVDDANLPTVVRAQLPTDPPNFSTRESLDLDNLPSYESLKPDKPYPGEPKTFETEAKRKNWRANYRRRIRRAESIMKKAKQRGQAQQREGVRTGRLPARGQNVKNRLGRAPVRGRQRRFSESNIQASSAPVALGGADPFAFGGGDDQVVNTEVFEMSGSEVGRPFEDFMAGRRETSVERRRKQAGYRDFLRKNPSLSPDVDDFVLRGNSSSRSRSRTRLGRRSSTTRRHTPPRRRRRSSASRSPIRRRRRSLSPLIRPLSPLRLFSPLRPLSPLRYPPSPRDFGRRSFSPNGFRLASPTFVRSRSPPPRPGRGWSISPPPGWRSPGASSWRRSPSPTSFRRSPSLMPFAGRRPVEVFERVAPPLSPPPMPLRFDQPPPGYPLRQRSLSPPRMAYGLPPPVRPQPRMQAGPGYSPEYRPTSPDQPRGGQMLMDSWRGPSAPISRPVVHLQQNQILPPPRQSFFQEQVTRPPASQFGHFQNQDQQPKEFCPCCTSEHHRLMNCRIFIEMKISARWDTIRRSDNICSKCLATGHRVMDCQSRQVCLVEGCKRPHHTLLHDNVKVKKEVVDLTLSDSDDEDQNQGHQGRGSNWARHSRENNACFNCEMPGHHIQNCPYIVCKRCHGSGHSEIVCKNKPGEFSGRQQKEPSSSSATMTVNYHHLGGGGGGARADIAHGVPPRPRNTMLGYLCEKMLAKGRSMALADEMVQTWALAGHNDETLYEIMSKNRPPTRTQLRLIMVKELAKAPSGSIPITVQISELLDLTVDYYMPNDRINMLEGRLATSGSAASPMLGIPSTSSNAASGIRREPNQSQQMAGALDKLKKLSAMIDAEISNEKEARIALEGRLDNLEQLRVYMIEKMRNVADQFGVSESYIQASSLTIVKLLAALGFSLYTLRRHMATFGNASLSEQITEKVRNYESNFPSGINSKYIVTFVMDYLESNA